MTNLLKNIYEQFVELMAAFLDKVKEWSQESIAWVYLFTSFLVLIALSQGKILFAILIFILGFSIEKRKDETG